MNEQRSSSQVNFQTVTPRLRTFQPGSAYRVKVFVVPLDTGWYQAYAPAFPGLVAVSGCEHAALDSLKRALAGMLRSLQAQGGEWPDLDPGVEPPEGATVKHPIIHLGDVSRG